MAEPENTEEDDEALEFAKLNTGDTQRPEEPDPPGPSFMALYTSLMLLLMTFFIVLFSMATTSTSKYHQAVDSVRDEFHNLGLTSSKQALVFIYSFIKIKVATQKLLEEEAKTEDVSQKEYTKVFNDLEDPEHSSKLGELIMMGLNIERKKEFLIIKIPTEDLFYEQTTDLNHKGRMNLMKIFNTLNNEYEEVIIKSYSRSLSQASETNSTEENSFYDSAKMAMEIATYIEEKLKVPGEKVTFYGNGKFRPITLEVLTEEDIRMNNRVEFWVKKLWTEDKEKALPLGNAFPA